MSVDLVTFARAHETATSGIAGALSGLLAALLIGWFSRASAKITAGSIVAAARKEAEGTISAATAQAEATISAATTQAAATISAATTQAAATRDAAFRNAFETERMKLRFEMTRRHLDAYHARSAEMHGLLSQAPNVRSSAQRLVDGAAWQPFLLCQTAAAAVTPKLYYGALARCALEFLKSHGDIANFIRAHRSDLELASLSHISELSEKSTDCEELLCQIDAAVDMAAEARAVGDPEQDILSQINRILAAVPVAGRCAYTPSGQGVPGICRQNHRLTPPPPHGTHP